MTYNRDKVITTRTYTGKRVSTACLQTFSLVYAVNCSCSRSLWHVPGHFLSCASTFKVLQNSLVKEQSGNYGYNGEYHCHWEVACCMVCCRSHGYIWRCSRQIRKVDGPVIAFVSLAAHHITFYQAPFVLCIKPSFEVSTTFCLVCSKAKKNLSKKYPGRKIMQDWLGYEREFSISLRW